MAWEDDEFQRQNQPWQRIARATDTAKHAIEELKIIAERDDFDGRMARAALNVISTEASDLPPL